MVLLKGFWAGKGRAWYAGPQCSHGGLSSISVSRINLGSHNPHVKYVIGLERKHQSVRVSSYEIFSHFCQLFIYIQTYVHIWITRS